jgi:hypothetical protein
MKLRIRGNSIRLRVTQSEVGKIKTTGLVEEKTDFPNGEDFIYQISIAQTGNLSASFSNGKIEILLPQEIADNWADSDEVGIYGADGNIQIAIEKDFKCLTPRQGDEDTDTFPHPKENC